MTAEVLREKSTLLFSSQLLLFVLRLGPTRCVFHSFHTLRAVSASCEAFGAPVTILDGGCRRHAGVECGSRGRPRQMDLAFGPERSVSEQ